MPTDTTSDEFDALFGPISVLCRRSFLNDLQWSERLEAESASSLHPQRTCDSGLSSAAATDPKESK